jgi:hypothetical protein
LEVVADANGVGYGGWQVFVIDVYVEESYLKAVCIF